jgi:ATP-binding cassette subfamily B protein
MVTNVIVKVYECFHSFTKFLTVALVVYFFNPLLSMLILLGVLPIMAWGLWYSPRMRAYSLVSREANSALVSRIQEIFSGIRVIKAYGSEVREQTNFERDSVVAFNSSYRVRSLLVLISIFGYTLMSVLLVIPGDFIMALWASRGADIFAVQLVAFLGLSYVAWNLSAFTYGKTRISNAIGSIRHLMYSWSQAQDMAVGLIRVFDILDIEPEVKDKEAAIPMPKFHHVVEFNRVSFSYEKDKPVLTDSSFRAEIGTISAIVGPTGCGKSTLMILLLRLFDPDNGSISIDGTDLRDFQIESLRENISIALQENMLFGMSVAENIRYNNPKASDEDVKAVAEIACADEFIRSLPDGYNTLLGDRGGKLSTGQRQRLSIARALIKDCDILILDEPTAALDAETEHRVLANLAQWGKDKVILLITHRISTIQRANQIMYLDKGRIQESGSHSELISIAGGYYRRFVERESEAAETSGEA